MSITIAHQFRANREYSAVYYDKICAEFAQRYCAAIRALQGTDKIVHVDFGKQDTRGIPSITLMDERHCVPHQKAFKTNAEMLAFMQGYLAALDNYMNIAKALAAKNH